MTDEPVYVAWLQIIGNDLKVTLLGHVKAFPMVEAVIQMNSNLPNFSMKQNFTTDEAGLVAMPVKCEIFTLGLLLQAFDFGNRTQ